MALFGIVGEKGAGKDASVEHLQTDRVLRYAFASPIKAGARALLGLTTLQTDDPVAKEVVDPRFDKTPRQLLQWLGTDCIRNQIDPDHWVNRFREWHDEMRALHPRRTIVVTDVRFVNEADAIRALGGSLIRIERPRASPTDAHVSERESSQIVVDHEVVNDSTLEALRDRVDSILDMRQAPEATNA